MLKFPWYFDPLIVHRMVNERPFHTYNPMMFAGVLMGRPLVAGIAMMVPFASLFLFPTRK